MNWYKIIKLDKRQDPEKNAAQKTRSLGRMTVVLWNLM